ncbi:hypothetical protein BO70DRAFT_232073 [Aspergillus heteromorphus CBS 117.55]|uniref:Uncharacterized protein n=1 Tax=Aspergillus heteromorphus CBS 117.55 TaxID=1448321 RepID=A0A317WI88_9EURO|nr:uncharacterized protein BO70DRAFT_232073 [Aspergillus heteromorphus CBS 117.55]PWY84992.1 hypothetical protein BO70DRAFT_232073 [Aspergillus heteromorphus CBS 117.55]
MRQARARPRPAQPSKATSYTQPEPLQQAQARHRPAIRPTRAANIFPYHRSIHPLDPRIRYAASPAPYPSIHSNLSPSPILSSSVPEPFSSQPIYPIDPVVVSSLATRYDPRDSITQNKIHP